MKLEGGDSYRLEITFTVTHPGFITPKRQTTSQSSSRSADMLERFKGLSHAVRVGIIHSLDLRERLMRQLS